MVILAVLAAISVLLFAVIFYVYQTAFYNPPARRCSIDDPMEGVQYETIGEHIQRISHVMEKIPCEEIWITSHDGHHLLGRYYHVRDGAPLEILFHGYRSCAFRDCSGGHALSRKMGFNALVVDQRAHGKSDGKTITFGIRERYDCARWVSYANNRFGADCPVILSGLSMGAATVLMAAGLELPKNVVCIIADSPYSAPSAILEKVCSDLHYPLFLCRPLLKVAARLFGGFDPAECTAKDAIAKSDIPVLLIHGEDDRLVPCSMSSEIAACDPQRIRVSTFPGAGHGLSYLIDPVRYEKVIYEFLLTIPALRDEISDSFKLQNYEN